MSVVSEFWIEDSVAVLMARVVGLDRAALQQADVSAIARTVYDLEDETVSLAESALTVANVIFDTLQTDARWTKDSTGYNFREVVPATAFPDGKRHYTVEYKFTLTGGEVFHFTETRPAKKILQS